MPPGSHPSSHRSADRWSRDMTGRSVTWLRSRSRNSRTKPATCTPTDRCIRILASVFPLLRGCLWSGAGSNRRPSAFQVNRAERCADLRKRTSPTSEAAPGGRCTIYGNRSHHRMSSEQGSDAIESSRPKAKANNRGRPWRDQHPVNGEPRDGARSLAADLGDPVARFFRDVGACCDRATSRCRSWRRCRAGWRWHRGWWLRGRAAP